MGVGLVGRPKVPTSLKIVRGNPGKRPLSEKEPKPEQGNPPKPAYFDQDPVASKEWDRITKLTTMKRARVLTKADGPMLEAAATAYSDFRAARETLRKEGTTYVLTTKSGDDMIRKRPEAEIAADSWRRWTQALTQFGLSPATRAKVEILDEGDGANSTEDLDG